jgi:His/Glu/Gln/Arg/opine family amino acid ABC transporter permease subunit
MVYSFAWSTISQSVGQLWAGLFVTVEILVISASVATVLGLVGSQAMLSRRRSVRGCALAYVELMRNSPSLVKMYFIYFGLPAFGIFPSAFWSGATALALHNAAYMMDVFRAAFASLPAGQTEAAKSLGLSRWAAFRVVLFPQALRRALPTLGNYWAEIVKDTSITSALSVRELYFVFTSEIALTQRTYEFFLVAGLIYLVLTTAISAIGGAAEKLLSRGDALR